MNIENRQGQAAQKSVPLRDTRPNAPRIELRQGHDQICREDIHQTKALRIPGRSFGTFSA